MLPSKTVPMMAMVLVAVLALPVCLSGADADQTFDRDYGDFYSYTLQFVFDGDDAESILWEFGDGSTSDEWNPKHTYADVGTYLVTQTTTNDKGQTVQVYRVNILGFPVVTFDTQGGSAIDPVQLTGYEVPVQRPADPVRDGYTFYGWFADAGCTTLYDWDRPVTASITLYAGWTIDSPAEHTVSFDVAGGNLTVDPRTIVHGATVVLPVYAGTCQGFTFGGWSDGDNVYDAGTELIVEHDMSFTAVWRPIVVDPDNPGNPDNPDNPTDPDDPVNPDDPTDPDDPVNPDDPEDSDGDDSGMIGKVKDLLDGPLGILLLLILTILVLLTVVRYVRRY